MQHFLQSSHQIPSFKRNRTKEQQLCPHSLISSNWHLQFCKRPILPASQPLSSMEERWGPHPAFRWEQRRITWACSGIPHRFVLEIVIEPLPCFGPWRISSWSLEWLQLHSWWTFFRCQVNPCNRHSTPWTYLRKPQCCVGSSHFVRQRLRWSIAHYRKTLSQLASSSTRTHWAQSLSLHPSLCIL